jgi:hypothetical protein
VLNRAARVMTAGHGGQILVADSTAVLLSGDGRLIPATKGVRIHDLRAYGGDAMAYRRRPLHPGSEVARAQQLRLDAYHLRRLHLRTRSRDPLPEPVAAVPDTSVVSLFG